MVDPVMQKMMRRLEIQQAFRPGAPIQKHDLFRGRSEQMQLILSAISRPGRHAALYGERGVGKTSLASVMSEMLEKTDPKTLISGTINCGTTDDFSSLWHKVFRELSLRMQVRGIGFAGMPPDATYTLDSMLNTEVQPDDIRYTLSLIRQSTVILLDEFNALKGNERVATLMAETIKNLSDHTLNVTIVVIGVADNVDELMAGHRSVGRSIEQIPMPRMTNNELREIIRKTLPTIGMTIDESAEDWIVTLSHGLPHYTHLLTSEAAVQAFDQERSDINDDDLSRAIVFAAGNEHSLMKAYSDAIVSPQKTSRHAEVLLACAKAPTDGLGWFAPADVVQPLGTVSSRGADVKFFSRHLSDFCDKERGVVLEHKGKARKIRYRFENPLMQPFVILQGIRSGMMKLERNGGGAS